MAWCCATHGCVLSAAWCAACINGNTSSAHALGISVLLSLFCLSHFVVPLIASLLPTTSISIRMHLGCVVDADGVVITTSNQQVLCVMEIDGVDACLVVLRMPSCAPAWHIACMITAHAGHAAMLIASMPLHSLYSPA